MLKKSLKFLFYLFLCFLIFFLVFEKTVVWANGGGGYVPLPNGDANGDVDGDGDVNGDVDGNGDVNGDGDGDEDGDGDGDEEPECTSGNTKSCGTCGVQKCVGGNWEDDCDETSEPDDDKTNDWNEYRCQGTGCSNQYIEHKKGYQDYTRSVTCSGKGKWKKGTWKKDGSPYYDTPSTIENCDLDWQSCSGNTEWSRTSRSCDCAGTCLETPQNPRYYNNPNYPTPPPESYEAEKYEPEESEDSNNIFLPVKLDWDNTKAWKNGWQEEDEVLKECSEDCFQSYLIEIDNTATGNFSKALTEDSEYNPSEDQQACFLKSDTTHNLKVSACCNANGTNCGPQSDWSFTTNSAPELISPQDPNWNDLELEEISSIIIPVSLKWCNVDQANSYRFRAYYVKPTESGNEEECHPDLVGANQECIGTFIEKKEQSIYSDLNDEERGLFSKAQTYSWQVTTCFLNYGVDCQDFSQKWNFKTREDYDFSKPTLLYPEDDKNGEKAVGLPIILKWRKDFGVNSFIYEISPSNITGKTTDSALKLDIINEPRLNLDTFYKWKVQPCWDEKSEECEQDVWSDEWTFKTTGSPPKLIYPGKNISNIPIPVKLDWENVSGAKSYEYWVYSNGKLIANNIIENNSVLIKYDSVSKEPKQETNYSWQVATCADKEGNICGESTKLQDFETFKLSAPSNLLPEDDETIFTYQMPKGFFWDSDAKYFKFTLDYIQKSEEEIGDCPLKKEGKNIIGNSYFVSLSCLGEYQWQVQSCLDENCNEKGESNIQNFTLNQTVSPTQFGLVPCGRSSYNPDTPWDEREPCEFKHLFILFRNILNFLLWKVTLIVLLLLVIGTAMIFYFSIGAPVMVIDIKGAWKAAGKGYAIIFLSWIIINLVLNILGYQVGIFGNWWQINF